LQRLFGCNRSAAPPADSLPSGGTEPSAHCRFGLDAVVFADAYETSARDDKQERRSDLPFTTRERP
jgi:hypothetical protein